MNFEPKNVLVTGSAGFIGCNYLRYVMQQNKLQKIISLDNLGFAGSEKNLQNLSKAIPHEFIKGDICDSPLVTKILQDHSIDTIVHFAAESHVDRSISGPGEFIQSNIVGTFTLLEAARNVWVIDKNWGMENCRFHHISTDEVYGSLKPEDPAFTEESLYKPNSPYSASKAGSDHLVRSYFHTYGLPVTTTNCSNNYGPYQHSEKFIPTVIRSCLSHSEIPIYGDGSNIRDWLYVDDHCDAIDKVIRFGKLGETYNVGGDNEWSNNDIAKVICNVLDELVPWEKPYSTLMTFVPDRLGHDWRYAINGKKLVTELNWKASLQFEEGIKKTISWYLENPIYLEK